MLSKKLAFAATLALCTLPARVALADDLKSVLARLDAASANFHTTSADFEFDTVTTQPIYDKEVQKGVAYYKREGHGFQMAAHIHEANSRPAARDLTYSAGKVLFYDAVANQERVMDAAKYESYLLLGFGASGRELADKWDIKYLGAEAVNGVKTDKLELVAKDPNVLKLFPKVTVWVDSEHAVSLKQVFDEGQGTSRTCIYSNIKTNQSLPKNAFTLKTNKQTKMVN
jgi:outer membrane lipoprotein-sorting protein